MKLPINDSYHISDIEHGDKQAYLEHFKEKQIYEQTLAIPYPYTEEDADWWVNHNIEETRKQSGQSVNWAIRRSSDDFLVGGIGFLGLSVGKSHKAELGYWLAKPYWNKGIMTEAVVKATKYGFEKLGLTRVTANVFHFNYGSERVLEKAGFRCEGYLRSHYEKDGKIFDGKLYAMIASDLKKPDQSGERPEFIKHYTEIQDEDNAHYPNSQELLSIGSPFAKKFGLKKIGIHHELLPPGRRTSWPHAESDEEEFVYVIEGYPDAWINGELFQLNAGDAVGFPSGTGICHTIINNTESNVRLLVVGETTKKDNKCYYALHPDRNQSIKEKGFLWEEPPPQEFKGHDGLPDKLRIDLGSL
ncbi:MAG: GNAT family N-acetyltransferase [Bdellovibrionales bacterium]|nr:GNAT family N-acetyltransferase [Bdellovibrionales bacterium]